MIPPQELKKKAFPKRMGGYEPLEVDEYIDFLIDKYTELFAQCDEYQTRLRAVATRIGEIQSEEEAIRTLAISTQKQCDNMLEEARADADKIFREAQKKAQAMISAGEKKEKSILLNAKQIAESTLLSISEKADAQIRNTQERADALLLSARTRCAKILNDFKKEINIQRSGLLQIKDVAENYNNILLNMYKEHLSSLASDMPEINIDLDALTESKLLESIMKDIKNDAAHIADKNSNVEYDFQEELNILKKEIENIQNINDDTYYDDLSKNDDDDEEIQTSDENNTATDIDTATDNIERTTVFTKVPEAKFEEDVKVFAAQAVHNTSDSTDATMVFDKTSINNSADSNEQQEQYQEQYEEEPVAMTYDSDDFQDYEEDYEEDDYNNTPATVANSKEDRLRDEYDDYAALRSLSNNNDDDDDDYPEESTKKGLFGLFGKKKNKKKTGKPKNNDDYADDEDSDDIDTEYDIDDDDDDYDIDIDDL